jgi:hypothetical protein
MNRRIVLLLVLAALGGLAWWLTQRSAPTSLDHALSDFAIADTATVDRIFIADQKGRSVDLRRTPQGWTVDGKYPTVKRSVDLLLRTFKRVEVRSAVAKAAEANVLRAMAAGGKKVEIYQGDDTPSKIWIVGHGTRDNFGTYMLLEKPGEGRSNTPFVMNMPGFTGILNTRFHTRLDEWRLPEVFRFNDLHDLASVEVELPAAPAQSYRIENLGGGKVRLLDLGGKPLPMDTVFVRGALLPYQQLNYEYIDRSLKPAQRDSLLASAPNAIVRATHRSGTGQQVKFWYMPYKGDEPGPGQARPLHDNLRMRALVQDTLLVVVQRAGFDAILQPASALKP